MNLAKGLLKADPVLVQTAPTFFGLTTDGSLELAQMASARLYDTTSGTVTIQRMLDRAALDIASFKRGTKADVSRAIKDYKKAVFKLEPVPASILRFALAATANHSFLSPSCAATVGEPAGDLLSQASNFVRKREYGNAGRCGNLRTKVRRRPPSFCLGILQIGLAVDAFWSISRIGTSRLSRDFHSRIQTVLHIPEVN